MASVEVRRRDLDDADRAILDHLRRDGRATVSDLALATGLRVEVSDLPAYERFHADQLAALHNVAQFVTYISMTDFSDL